MFEDVVINYWAVLGSTVIGMVLGFVWYSPWLFGRAWMRLNRLTEQDVEAVKKSGGMLKASLGALLNCFLISFALAFILDRVGAYDVTEGLIVAGVLWIGFIVPVVFSGVLWERKPFSLFLISVGHYLVFLSAAGVVLMLFP